MKDQDIRARRMIWQGDRFVDVAEAKPKRRRDAHFVMVPMTWRARLDGASAHTILLGWDLLYLHWREGGGPIQLGNRMLKFDGISRQSKWRALADLEHRGLIIITRRPKKSPIVQVLV